MTWLPNARVVDLTGRSNGAGNGPFGPGQFYGVVLHCNGGVGVDTPDQFFIDGGGRDSVCPNFQVHADGSISQYLPLEWSPWCQENGNANYAAIETAGGPDPLNPAQLASVARIVRAYHDILGMPLQLAEGPGQRGLGYHAMGGATWGGHPCPLPARIAQRAQILQLAGAESTDSNGAIRIGDDSMSAATEAQILKQLTAIQAALTNVQDQNHRTGVGINTDYTDVKATLVTLAHNLNTVAGSITAAVHANNVTLFKRTIDQVSHTYGQVDQITPLITTLHEAGGNPDLAPVLDAISKLPADIRAELAKHLGA